MPYNQKEYNHSVKVGKERVENAFRDIEVELYSKARTEQRQEQSESVEYITNDKLRKMMQNYDHKKTEAINVMAQAGNNLKKNFKRYIINSLKLDENSSQGKDALNSHLTFEHIQGFVNSTLPAFQKLKALSEDPDLRKSMRKSIYTAYEDFFAELIMIEPRFAFFAPKAVFNKPSIQERISKLNAIFKVKLNNYYKAICANENANYISSNKVTTLNATTMHNLVASQMVQDVEKEQSKAVDIILDGAKNLRDDLFKFIYDELKINNMPYLQHRDIIRVLEVCKPQRTLLKKIISDTNELISNRFENKQFDYYDEMFNDLVDKDIKFSLYAPKSTMERLDINYYHLSGKEKEAFVKRAEQFGLFEDKKFVEKYYHVFNLKNKLKNIKTDNKNVDADKTV